MNLTQEKKQFLIFCLLLTFFYILSATNVYAAGTAAAKIKALSNSYLYPAVQTAGNVFLLLGAGKFAIAMTSDQADQISKGIAELAAGAVLANIKLFMGSSADIKSVMDTLESIIRTIGAVVAIYGGLALGIGFTQDNSAEISKGIKIFIGGALLFGVSHIVGWFEIKG